MPTSKLAEMPIPLPLILPSFWEANSDHLKKFLSEVKVTMSWNLIEIHSLSVTLGSPRYGQGPLGLADIRSATRLPPQPLGPPGVPLMIWGQWRKCQPLCHQYYQAFGRQILIVLRSSCLKWRLWCLEIWFEIHSLRQILIILRHLTEVKVVTSWNLIWDPYHCQDWGWFWSSWEVLVVGVQQFIPNIYISIDIYSIHSLLFPFN